MSPGVSAEFLNRDKQRQAIFLPSADGDIISRFSTRAEPPLDLRGTFWLAAG
ncbi:hypothetical protein OEZ60_21310 [Defluviimonas sp. WL0024]|uniref:Uncharacterized protein n=1 Tax=Albidovulum salinarum TaxID=2984153 RepID=A0ABT2X995_9RHOB|nr:hypothetical protein [Defluviimonas sp. WL0024]